MYLILNLTPGNRLEHSETELELKQSIDNISAGQNLLVNGDTSGDLT